MARHKTRNEIISYAVTGVVVLIGTVALMLFGANSVIEDDIGPLLAGLLLSAGVFRFGLPWKWLYVPFLMSPIVVPMLLGAPGLMWFGGYVAGTSLGVAWRMAVIKPKVKSKWTVDNEGFNTISEARTAARKALLSLNGKRQRVVIEHGTARFEVAGALPSMLVCHRNQNGDDDFTWAILSRSGVHTDEHIDVPMGKGSTGFIPSRFVNDIAPVEAALSEFFKDPKSDSFGPDWYTGSLAHDLRLSS